VGIGEAAARLFANNGARMVVIADIQDEVGQRVAESIGLEHAATSIVMLLMKSKSKPWWNRRSKITGSSTSC
jgi:NAD(P)-dependent dehydrogenase (short-subunit alcohol dehydrogenase family)